MRRLSALVFLLLLGLVVPAWAQAPATDEASKQRALKIARDWLHDNTDYKQIPDISSWVVLSDERMIAQARVGGDLPGRGVRHVPGFIYNCGERRLYQQQGVNFFDIAILSLLVHELTHHAQCLTGKSFADICAIEREAYLNQQRFVRWTQARLAAAGRPPLGPEVEKFASNDLPALIDTVCAATRRRN